MRSLLPAMVIVALLGGVAGAQGENDEGARAAFVEGNVQFKLGRFLAAAAAWEHGFELKHDAGFLYNIAQAYRLAELPDKALFFYRGYLSAAPDAPNRAQVEERVAQLERLLVERANATTPSPQPLTLSSSPPAEHATTTARATTTAGERARHVELEASIGLALWVAGVPSGTSPSLAASIAGGYCLALGRLALRLGGTITYSYLREADATDHFLALYASPLLRVPVFRKRLFFDGELGVGAQLVAGLPAGSPLLSAAHGNGTLAAFALRPAIALEARATSRLALRLNVAAAYSPVAGFASPSLVRVELLLAAILRL